MPISLLIIICAAILVLAVVMRVLLIKDTFQGGPQQITFLTKFLAPLILILALVGGFQELLFFANSKEAVGTVTNISSSKVRCGKYNKQCTNFEATVTYTTQTNQSLTSQINAGQNEGDVSLSSANYKIGQQVNILYDLRTPSKIQSKSENSEGAWLILGVIIVCVIGTYFGYFRSS